MSGRWSIVLLIAILAGVILTLFYNNRSGDGPSVASANRTVKVQRGDVISRLAETGSLEPLGLVEIKSEQSGEVKRLFVGEGHLVNEGQPLAIIQQESSQARQAAQFRASLEEERLNMEEAERERKRQVRLFHSGFVSERDVEEAEKRFQDTRIKHDLAKRQLLLVLGGNQKILEQYLSRDLSSDVLDQFVIKSPASGTVIELGIQEGEMITSGTATVGGGTALMSIANLSRMVVISRINEVNITAVQLGQQVEIRLDAIQDRVYQGEVVAIAPRGERINNVVTYQVTIEVQKPDELLKPSMTANVDIITGIYEDVLYLPIEAVSWENGSDGVRIETDGQIRIQPVKLLARTENTAVIASGVQEGDAILIPETGTTGLSTDEG